MDESPPAEGSEPTEEKQGALQRVPEDSPAWKQLSSDPAFRRTVFFGVLAGLCPLIPIPFVDDMALDFIRRRMIRGHFSQVGLKLRDSQLKAMTEGEPQGCVKGCVTGVGLYLPKKIFRKVFFFLAIKDCVDHGSAAIHEGLLIRHALARGLVDPGLALGDESVKQLADAVAETTRKADTRPMNQMLKRAFEGSRGLMTRAAASVARALQLKGARQPDAKSVEQAMASMEQDHDGPIGELVDKVGEMMWAERGYLRGLEQALEKNLSKASQAPEVDDPQKTQAGEGAEPGEPKD